MAESKIASAENDGNISLLARLWQGTVLLDVVKMQPGINEISSEEATNKTTDSAFDKLNATPGIKKSKILDFKLIIIISVIEL